MSPPRNFVGACLFASLATAACGGESGTITTGGDSGLPTTTTATSTSTTSTSTTSTSTSTSTSTTGTGVLATITEAQATLNSKVSSVVEVTWTQDVPTPVAYVEWTFEDGTWSTTPLDEPGVAGQNDRTLLGIPTGANVTFRVVAEDRGAVATSPDGTIRTGSLPSTFPTSSAVTYDASLLSPYPWIFAAMSGKSNGGSPWYLIIFDRKGRAVWWWQVPNSNWSLYPRIALDGTHIKLEENSYYTNSDSGAASKLHSLSLRGEPFDTVALPYPKHPWVEMADGSIVWGRVEVVSGSNNDNELLYKRNPDGSEEELWDCQAWLREAGRGIEWCSSNAIWYDERYDTFLYSFFTHDTVAEIDHASGETVAWYGDVEGGYAFSPTDSQFWFQHGVHYTTDGTILVSTKSEERGRETHAREYEVDRSGEKLTLVWSYGEGEGQYASQIGEVHRLENGNHLINYGANAKIREITYDGDLLWELSFSSNSHYMGRSIPFMDLYELACLDC